MGNDFGRYVFERIKTTFVPGPGLPDRRDSRRTRTMRADRHDTLSDESGMSLMKSRPGGPPSIPNGVAAIAVRAGIRTACLRCASQNIREMRDSRPAAARRPVRRRSYRLRTGSLRVRPDVPAPGYEPGRSEGINRIV